MREISAICVAVFAASAVAEDITNAFTKCATTKDDKARLACYDSIRDNVVRANTKANEAGQHQTIALADLKTDIKSMRGQKVAVKANIQTVGGMSMLKSDPMDMAPVFADTESLPREDRKKLLNGCQVILCSGVFYGTVKTMPLGIGLVLEKATWN
jgi:hypothetical protein